MSGSIIPGTNAAEVGSLTRAIYDRLVAEFGEPPSEGQTVWRNICASIAQGVVGNLVATLSDTSFLQVNGGSLVGEENPGGSSGAPAAAEYVVGVGDAGLPNARTVADTSTVVWDQTVANIIGAHVPNDGIGDAQLRNSAANSLIGRAAGTSGDPADIAIATSRLFGRLTGNIGALTGTEATTLLDVFTNTLKGLVPSGSGGDSDQVLRGDQTWARLITRIAGSSGAVGPDITWQHLSSDATIATSASSPFMTTTGLVSGGLYTFKYKLLYQSNAQTGGMGWAIQFTGSESHQVAASWYVSDSATLGRSDSASSAAGTGQPIYGTARRTFSTTPQGNTEGVDTANSNQLMIIEGIFVPTSSGNLILYVNSEDNASTITVLANTTLELHRIR
jgi:hypothetical protein